MAAAEAQPNQARHQVSQGSLEGSIGEQDQRGSEPAIGAAAVGSGAAQTQANAAAGAAATGSADVQPKAGIVAGAHEESIAAAEQASRMLQQGEVLHGDAPRAGRQGCPACRVQAGMDVGLCHTGLDAWSSLLPACCPTAELKSGA